MNTQNIMSINPIGEPSGMHLTEDFFRPSVAVAKQSKAMKSTLRLILGVTGDVKDARRRWTFRVILGAILMSFGLLFMQSGVFGAAEHVASGISLLMVAGGAFVACGLMTRMVSFALGIILTMALCHLGEMYMAGYSLLVCIGACVAGIVIGSGRYSLDTLLYNRMVR